jgi:hypothetical protein
LSLQADGYARARVGPFTVDSGKEHSPIEIRMERASVRLTGRVVMDDHPLPNAFLTLNVREPRESIGLALNGRSDAQGRFVFEAVEPGLHALAVAARRNGIGSETVMRRQLITVPPKGLDELLLDLGDHGGEHRLVIEINGQRNGSLAVTLRAGTVDERRLAELDLERVDPGDCRAIEPNQGEVAFERVAPGAYTVSVSQLDVLDPSVLGYSLAGLKTVALRHIEVREEHPESKILIPLE